MAEVATRQMIYIKDGKSEKATAVWVEEIQTYVAFPSKEATRMIQEYKAKTPHSLK